MRKEKIEKIRELASSFQQAVFDTLIIKMEKAIKKLELKIWHWLVVFRPIFSFDNYFAIWQKNIMVKFCFPRLNIFVVIMQQ